MDLKSFQLIKQGAEAKIYKGTYLGKPTIAKERFEKTYRNIHLDFHLTKDRIKAECRAIVRCKSCGIKTPTLYLVDFDRRTIFMQYFPYSITVKDYILTVADDKKIQLLSHKIGTVLGTMHKNAIVHGDLTTSNMLLVNKNKLSSFVNFDDLQLTLIDFGLAQLAASAEDKGVDLYVFERAVGSTHAQADDIIPVVMQGYKEAYKSGFKEVYNKYEEVRARGRKRTMVG